MNGGKIEMEWMKGEYGSWFDKYKWKWTKEEGKGWETR